MLSIEEKKARIEQNGRLEAVPEVPFLIEVGGFHGSFKRFFESDQAEIDWNVEYHKSREGIDDYGMPNIKPNLGIGIIAAAFGCAETPNDEADPWIKPLLKEENLDDVHTLKLPDPETNPVYQRAWKRVEFMQKTSPLPLRVINIPSPLVTASLIWEYTSFIEALMVFPDEVHVLMDKITKATIAYVQEQYRRIANLHSVSHEMWYVPRAAGCGCPMIRRPCCHRISTGIRRQVQQRDFPRVRRYRRPFVRGCSERRRADDGDRRSCRAGFHHPADPELGRHQGRGGRKDRPVPQALLVGPRCGRYAGRPGRVFGKARRLFWPQRSFHPDIYANSRRSANAG